MQAWTKLQQVSQQPLDNEVKSQIRTMKIGNKLDSTVPPPKGLLKSKGSPARSGTN